jgi:hypothetical protein
MTTNGSSLTTVKMDLIHYTGTLKLQAAQDYLAEWYDVTESREYLDATESVYFNAVGFHPLLRIALNTSIGYGATAQATVVDGVVTSILLTNAGESYFAPPYVHIIGYGAVATAVTAGLASNNPAVTDDRVCYAGCICRRCNCRQQDCRSDSFHLLSPLVTMENDARPGFAVIAGASAPVMLSSVFFHTDTLSSGFHRNNDDR